MTLQQSTTFRPFVRKLVMLAQIATRTSNHQIARVIGSTTREGNYMINMVLIKLLFAPITLALLTLILNLNVSLSMLPFGIMLTSNAIKFNCVVLLSMSFIVSTLLLTNLFTINNVVDAMMFSRLFDMHPVKHPSLLLMFLSTGFRALIGFIATLAINTQFIIAVFIAVKVFSSGEVIFVALKTVLQWYNRIHGKAYSLSSRQGMLAHRSGTAIFSTYIIPQSGSGG